MQQQAATKENIHSLIEFRQAIYAHSMLDLRDALFELPDALIAEGRASSFVILSQSEHFRRERPSLSSTV